MNEGQFKKLKVGSIISENKTSKRFVVLTKSPNGLGVYNYLAGEMMMISHVSLLKEFSTVNIKDTLSMEANIHPNLSVMTKFINGAIKLYQNNPVFYKRIMEGNNTEKDLSYISDRMLDVDRVVINKQTKKSYTIVDVRNISNNIYYNLFRNGMVLGQVMEYERLFVSQKEFYEFYEFAKDVEYIEEPLYLYTDDEVKKLIGLTTKPHEVKTQKVKKEKLVQTKTTQIKNKFMKFGIEKPVIKINKLEKLNDLSHKGNYIDLFTGGLYKGAKFLLKSPTNNKRIFEVTNIQNRLVEGLLYDNNDISTKKKITILDILLYKSLITLNYNDTKSTFFDSDIYQKIHHDGKAIDKFDNKEYRLEEINNLYCLNVGNGINSDIPIYTNRYSPILEDDFNKFKKGKVLVYNNSCALVVYKCNKQSFNCYINFFDLTKDIIRVNISNKFLEDNMELFRIVPEISFYYLCNQ